MLCKLTKCCFCFPLRSGLLVFGYINLIILYIHIITIICHMSDYFQGISSTDPISYIALSLGLGISLIAFFFVIILLAGIHKRSSQLLEVYYECNLCMLITQMVMAALYVPLQAYRSYPVLKSDILWLILGMIFVATAIIVFQFYLTSLVKSHIRAVRNENSTVELHILKREESNT